MTEQDRDEGGAVLRLPARPPCRWRGVAIAGVIVIAGTLALASVHRPSGPQSRFAVVERDVPTSALPDPLMAALIRCRALPPQVDDPACRAAWEENRVRFFGERRAMRVPGDPLPTYQPIPSPFATPNPER